MSATFGSIDYERIAKAMGRANTSAVLTVDLTSARVLGVAPAVSGAGIAIRILTVGAGTYSLVIAFQDGSTVTLTNAQIAANNVYNWDFLAIYVVNTAQPAVTFVIQVDNRIITGVSANATGPGI